VEVTQVFKDITPQEASDLIQQNEGNPDFQIIDVRTPEEFNDGHIENAIMIDFYAEDFRDEIAQLDREKSYFVYCRSGNRSGQAVDIMRELGFQKVYNLSAGIREWVGQGLPTVK
jgi:rhodanese-related sulfurtransferase